MLSRSLPISLSSEPWSLARQSSITWQVIGLQAFENAFYITDHTFCHCIYTSVPCLFSSWMHASLILYLLKWTRCEQKPSSIKSKYELEWKECSDHLQWHSISLLMAWVCTYLCSHISFYSFFKERFYLVT